jgi:hypothetical protein
LEYPEEELRQNVQPDNKSSQTLFVRVLKRIKVKWSRTCLKCKHSRRKNEKKQFDPSGSSKRFDVDKLMDRTVGKNAQNEQILKFNANGKADETSNKRETSFCLCNRLVSKEMLNVNGHCIVESIGEPNS